jgi:hypothetical protein
MDLTGPSSAQWNPTERGSLLRCGTREHIFVHWRLSVEANGEYERLTANWEPNSFQILEWLVALGEREIFSAGDT